MDSSKELLKEDRLLDLVKRAEAGDSEAKYLYIQNYLLDESACKNEGLKSKYDDYTRELANSGDPGALILLAELAEDQIVTDEYYSIAAEAGETVGYEFMAERYIKGINGPADYQKAYELLKRSEDESKKLRSDSGNYYMGEMFYFGLYVPKDWNIAKKYYRQIIKHFNGGDYHWKACARLATIYEPIAQPEYQKSVEQMKRVVAKHTIGMTEAEVAELLGMYK